MPSSITAVYDKLMDQIDPSLQAEVLTILSILSIAAPPMKLDELAIVLAMSRDRRISRSTDLDCASIRICISMSMHLEKEYSISQQSMTGVTPYTSV